MLMIRMRTRLVGFPLFRGTAIVAGQDRDRLRLIGKQQSVEKELGRPVADESTSISLRVAGVVLSVVPRQPPRAELQ